MILYLRDFDVEIIRRFQLCKYFLCRFATKQICLDKGKKVWFWHWLYPVRFIIFSYFQFCNKTHRHSLMQITKTFFRCVIPISTMGIRAFLQSISMSVRICMYVYVCVVLRMGVRIVLRLISAWLKAIELLKVSTSTDCETGIIEKSISLEIFDGET